MLRWRLLLGGLFIGGLVALCCLDAMGTLGLPPGGWLFPLALILSLLASGEMLWLLSARDIRPAPWLVYGGNLAIVASCSMWLFGPFGTRDAGIPLAGLGLPLAAFVASSLAAFLLEIYRYTEPGRCVERLSATLLSFVYVSLLLSFVIQLRTISLVALISLIAVVKVGDIGAYTVGRIFGRHKMTPRLSPGKTWEGAVGHIAAACLAAWLVLAQFGPKIDPKMPASLTLPLNAIAYGAIVGLFGLLGDLAESLLKRDLGRKDSSPWMPGFGGVLDILDSILIAAPVAYFWWVAVMR